MENPSPPIRCDCLQGGKTAHSFGDRSTRIAYVNEQVAQIDRHIQQLIEQRSALLHHSNQLQSPFYDVPPEIISNIFQEAVRVRSFSLLNSDSRYANLHQAFVLSSVSRFFRQVTLGTPQLWNRLEFNLSTAKRAINNFVPILQHCLSHISNLHLGIKLHNVSYIDVREEDVPPMTQALFSPDTANKVKYLALHRTPDWILPACLTSFPILDTLFIDLSTITNLNLHPLPLSRVFLNLHRLESIILPPSVQVLNLNKVHGRLVISVLHQQCPNPVECSTARERAFEIQRCSTSRHPLTLHNLKQLTWSSDASLQTIRNLRLPSLERLRLRCCRNPPDIDAAVISLCEEVSATLVSLNLEGYVNFGGDGLRKLCRLNFPHLEKLKFNFFENMHLFEAIEVLISQAESENNTPEIKYMPNLRYLSLSNLHNLYESPNRFSRLFLDLLKQKRFREETNFHLDFSVTHSDGDEILWPLELREELRSAIQGSNLKLTKRGYGIEWL